MVPVDGAGEPEGELGELLAGGGDDGGDLLVAAGVGWGPPCSKSLGEERCSCRPGSRRRPTAFARAWASGAFQASKQRVTAIVYRSDCADMLNQPPSRSSTLVGARVPVIGDPMGPPCRAGVAGVDHRAGHARVVTDCRAFGHLA
ncbi:hypothetical protein TNCT6_62350 [Streptomyces sp. 6-11-2]|nr:hypothetical protein TNCT6_62350 [Streptomyces sp. 6-11-2]